MATYGDYATGIVHEQRSRDLREQARRDGLIRAVRGRPVARAGRGESKPGREQRPSPDRA
jgi:hypothetical protein